MALNINGTTGISGVDGSASAPALQGTDSNTGINFASDTVNINTGGVTRASIDSAGKLTVTSTSTATNDSEPVATFTTQGHSQIRLNGDGNLWALMALDSSAAGNNFIIYDKNNAVERLRINSDGKLLIGTTDTTPYNNTGSNEGVVITPNNMQAARSGDIPFFLNRLDSGGGTLAAFYRAGSQQGTISVSGSTVSYNGGHLSRWSQIKGLSQTDKSARPEIYQGTVMSNLDDLCTWTHAETFYEEDVLYTQEDTLPEGKSVGDVKNAKGSVQRAAYTEDNQQLNMTKISDTEGDKNIAGVFYCWDDDDDEIVNDFYVAMTGDMVIRVAASTTVARGDLLISAGDGTAKPQADDIVRSSTIAKIISTTSTATYADGSKAYPCVLMAC